MEKYKKYEPIFGSWYLGKLLGKGSFGKVFEITREEFGTTYRSALKIITVPQDEEDIKTRMSEGTDIETISEYYEGILKEIINENEIMSQLKGNSNIVSYEDHQIIPHDDGVGYDILIRMELLTPLLDRMIEKKLDEKEVVQLGIDICRALELCHRKNIIHRDIKPQNIFISENGDYKLGDFGIARTMEKTTGGMSKKGTYKYMAPEVFRGEDYDLTVDIYSLGIVLYSLLNGNRGPFLPAPPAKVTHNDEEEARQRRFRGEPIPTPRDAGPMLGYIIQKACAADPSRRYQTAEQMRRDLESYLDNYGNLSEQTFEEPDEGSTVFDPNIKADVRARDISEEGKKDNKRLMIIIAALAASLLIVVITAAVVTHINGGGGTQGGDTGASATGEDTSSGEEGASDADDSVYTFSFNGHRYEIVNDGVTWNMAKDACEAANGHLVTVTSAQEHDRIVEQLEKLDEIGEMKSHYWLGGIDKGDNNWYWINNEGKIDEFKRWRVDQPNGGNGDENYLELTTIDKTDPKSGSDWYMSWNDIRNDGTTDNRDYMYDTQYYGYICEWDE